MHKYNFLTCYNLCVCTDYYSISVNFNNLNYGLSRSRCKSAWIAISSNVKHSFSRCKSRRASNSVSRGKPNEE